MPTNRLISWRPWNPFFTLGLIMGVCLFSFLVPSKTLALEADSPLFEQKAGSASSQPSAGQPLALPVEKPNPSPGLFSTFLRLLFALVVVVGLIILTVWGLKIFWEKRGWGIGTDEGKLIKVLASAYLAPRKTIYLVEIGKRVLVVGVGNGEMSSLDVITEHSEVEFLRQTAQQGFPKIFGRVMQKEEAAEQELETRKILEESKRVVGATVERLKEFSKKKSDFSRKKEGD